MDLGDASTTTIPNGTCLVFYCEHGEAIFDYEGNAIELGMNTPRPVEIAGAGQVVPNYWLDPPLYYDPLVIAGNPRTVVTPTRLSDLLSPNMGICHWAACRE